MVYYIGDPIKQAQTMTYSGEPTKLEANVRFIGCCQVEQRHKNRPTNQRVANGGKTESEEQARKACDKVVLWSRIEKLSNVHSGSRRYFLVAWQLAEAKPQSETGNPPKRVGVRRTNL